MKIKTALLLTTGLLAASLLSGCTFKSTAELRFLSATALVEQDWGEGSVQRVIALTELTDKHDLFFYENAEGAIAASILIKDGKGCYTDAVATSSRSPEDTNKVVGSSRQKLPGYTLYWGIGASPAWRIDHEGAHYLVVDDLTLCYYFHDKTLDDEQLELNFVQTEA